MAEVISMPKLGFDMAEGTLVRWVVGEGESIEKGQVLAEIETDKATVEVESSASGVVNRHLVEEGTVVPIGTAIAVVAAPGEEVKDLPELAQTSEKPTEEGPAETESSAEASTPATEAVTEPSDGRTKASPLARRMAEENGLDLAAINGSGPEGRVVKRDVEEALAGGGAAPQVQQAAASVEKAAVPVSPLTWAPGGAAPSDQRVPVEKLRSIIGKRMTESKTQLPHFYVTHEYRAEALMDLRKQINAVLLEDQKVSVNDLIVKAVALTLRQFPNINASLDGNEIVRHGRVNVGVAVALDTGLITVVSKDADQKPVRLISQEVKNMVARARAGKVRTEDIDGSTFSISNLGMFDVEHFIAIINPPEAAILAVGSIKEVPVVEDGQLKVGSRFKATISADHRITDGAEAARFMLALAEYIEKPLRLLV